MSYHIQELLLTETQIKKLVKAARDGTGVQIRLSAAQLKHSQLGKGLFGNILKAVAPVAIDGLAGLAKKKLGGGRKRTVQGKGRLTDALKSIVKRKAPDLIDNVCSMAKAKVNGMGLPKHARITNGHGIFAPR